MKPPFPNITETTATGDESEGMLPSICLRKYIRFSSIRSSIKAGLFKVGPVMFGSVKVGLTEVYKICKFYVAFTGNIW